VGHLRSTTDPHSICRPTVGCRGYYTLRGSYGCMVGPRGPHSTTPVYRGYVVYYYSIGYRCIHRTTRSTCHHTTSTYHTYYIPSIHLVHGSYGMWRMDGRMWYGVWSTHTVVPHTSWGPVGWTHTEDMGCCEYSYISSYHYSYILSTYPYHLIPQVLRHVEDGW
jgi:hypothetical protein